MDTVVKKSSLNNLLVIFQSLTSKELLFELPSCNFANITPVCLSRWKISSSQEYYQLNVPSYNCLILLVKPQNAPQSIFLWVCMSGKTKQCTALFHSLDKHNPSYFCAASFTQRQILLQLSSLYDDF